MHSMSGKTAACKSCDTHLLVLGVYEQKTAALQQGEQSCTLHERPLGYVLISTLQSAGSGMPALGMIPITQLRCCGKCIIGMLRDRSNIIGM